MKALSLSPIALSLTLFNAQAQNTTNMLATNQNAPIYCTKSIVINAAPEKVWKVLTSINDWNTWMSTVSTAKLNGNLEPSTTFDWKTGGTKIHSKLHTVNPFSAFGWTGKVYGVYAIHNWEFKSLGNQTEVVVSESMQGFLVRLFKKSFNKTLEKDMTKSLDELKKACEK